MHSNRKLRKKQENLSLRAADDFLFIKRRVAELAAERRVVCSASTGNQGPDGFDVICDQPAPEDYGIIDGGGGHIAIRRDRVRS